VRRKIAKLKMRMTNRSFRLCRPQLNPANAKQLVIINYEQGKPVTPPLLTNRYLSRPVKSFNLGASPFPTTVAGDTLLTVPPVNKTVMEGETVGFDCIAKGEGTVVTWFREGVPIPDIQVKIFSGFCKTYFQMP